MKIIKALILLIVIGFASCDVNYYENPNEPTTPPSNAVFNDAVKSIMDDTRDLFFGGGRFTQVTMQYWHQSEYGDEDRYAYRESMREFWEDFYYDLENLRQVIALNTNPETRDAASAYGNNKAQIACSRIMMSYLFNMMADVWGPIPYWSYGSDDEDFQALQITSDEEILRPAYAPQDKIYADILNELKGAYQQLDEVPADESGFSTGDRIYGGDINKWMKFANSLRLRIAMKVKEKDAQLGQSHIDEVINSGVYFQSNADNAVFRYEGSDKNSSPYYAGWYVDNRSDFAIGNGLVQTMKNQNIEDPDGNPLTDNPFVSMSMTDPRLQIYARPNENGNILGMPIALNSDVAATISWESLPGMAIIDKPDYPMVLMEYAEVEFLLSEENGWEQTHYENGVRASMQRWNTQWNNSSPVEPNPYTEQHGNPYDITADIDAYINNLPPASEETVMTQKYIALYMQATQAWTEYRRTGYPKTMVKPGDEYTIYVPGNDTTREFVFEAAVQLNDLPTRMKYPAQEQTLNEDNYKEARQWLPNGDAQDSKLWWDVD